MDMALGVSLGFVPNKLLGGEAMMERIVRLSIVLGEIW